MKTKRTIRLIGGLLVVAFALVFGIVQNANAIVSNTNWNSTVMKKALLTGAYRCYTTGAIDDDVPKLSGFKGFTDVIIGGSNENYVALPSGLTAITDNGVSCEQLFDGYGSGKNSFEGLFELSGKQSSPTTKDGKINLLEGMGYQKVDSEASTDLQCISFKFQETYSSYGAIPKEIQTEQLCATLDNDGKIATLTRDESTATYSRPGDSVNFFDVSNSGKVTLPRTAKTSNYGNTTTVVTTQEGIGSTWDAFTRDLRSTISGQAASFNYTFTTYGQNLTYSYNLEGETTEGNIGESNTGDIGYRIKDERRVSSKFAKAANSAIEYLSNEQLTDYASLELQPAEQISLYTSSLKEYFYSGVDPNSYWKCNVSDWTDYGKFPEQYAIKISPDGKKADCRLDPSAVKNSGTINGVSGNYFDASGTTTFDLLGTIGKINKLVEDNEEELDEEEIIAPPIDDGGNTAEEQTCSNSGGAISLGWIVCPILTWMGNASESLYSDYIGPSLNINAGLFNDNTFSAWSTFRSLSNIIFIIFILVVIFSQLTGVGIDNYGIKKLLPKLIVTAVLVNLSYIICELCVDLSNIIGASIKGLFDGMGANLQPIVSIENSNLNGSAIGSTAITGVAVLATLVGMIGAVWANPAILLTLFITAIGVIISIFFLFILLAARKAGVIVLAVASPIALVCYMLPNTQNIFKKYLKIAEGLLLVYPICGALVGGGDYVAKLLLSSGLGAQGFVAAFTAMTVGVVPIFFIPSVLKGSFAAMGNLGAKISGVGQGLRTRATKGIQGTERYRTLQERGQQRSTRIRAGLDIHGNEKEVGKVGRFLRGGTRGMARSRAQYLKDNDTRFREGELMGAGFAAASLSQQKRAEKDQLANEMVLMNNATNNGEIEGGDKGLFALYDRAMLDGNKTRARAIAEIAGRRKDTAARFLEHHEQLVASDGYRNIESRAAQDRIAGVMKQIATGDNAKNYRAADGVNFEYASQYNKGETTLSFSDWRAQGGSVDTAIEHNITNGADLYGQKGSSLKALRDDIDAGRVSAEKLEQLKKIYENTQNDQFKASGAYDATKDAILQEIYQKAGGASRV